MQRNIFTIKFDETTTKTESQVQAMKRAVAFIKEKLDLKENLDLIEADKWYSCTKGDFDICFTQQLRLQQATENKLVYSIQSAPSEHIKGGVSINLSSGLVEFNKDLNQLIQAHDTVSRSNSDSDSINNQEQRVRSHSGSKSHIPSIPKLLHRKKSIDKKSSESSPASNEPETTPLITPVRKSSSSSRLKFRIFDKKPNDEVESPRPEVESPRPKVESPKPKVESPRSDNSRKYQSLQDNIPKDDEKLLKWRELPSEACINGTTVTTLDPETKAAESKLYKLTGGFWDDWDGAHVDFGGSAVEETPPKSSEEVLKPKKR